VPPGSTRLALLSQFPAGYTGVGADVNATSSNDSCIKLDSPIVNPPTVTPQQPGAGQCGGPNGVVQPGDYQLREQPPSGTIFVRWDCYDLINNQTLTQTGSLGTLTLPSGLSVTCVAVYEYAPSPSPGVPSR
jgi:hypothetical protein